MIVYDVDANAILAEPMKNRTSTEFIAAYKRIHALLVSRGLRPQLQKLDNECSAALKAFMHSEAIDFQLVPPHLHRRNAAERAIRTFKNHFIAGLCSTDPAFPLNLWDQLLKQAEITLNLMRRSRINPQLSAHAQIHGAFDFNRTPLGPPGTRVLVHEKPSVRQSWAPHAVDGWYLGPAMLHYRCFQVWIISTSSLRIADTLSWFPSQVKMPTASSTDAAIAAARDLIHALQHPSPASALSPLADHQHAALLQLADIFSSTTAPPYHGRDADATPPVPPGFPALEAVAPDLTIALPPPAPQLAAVPAPPTPPVPVPAVTFAPGTAPPAAIAVSAPRVPERLIVRFPRVAPVPLVDTDGFTPVTQRRRRQQPNAPAATQLPTDHPHNTRFRTSRLDRHLALSVTADTVSRLSEVVATPILPNTPPPSPLPPSPSLPAHAFWTANSVIDPTTGASLEYAQLKLGADGVEWIHAASLEIGRLAQGIHPHMPTGSDTIHFIKHTDKPFDRKATYLRIVTSVRTNKAESKRVRFTVGGDRVDYPGDTSTPTVDLTTIKIQLNSVLSTPDAKFMTADISDFYLNTPLPRKEYMRIPVKDIPQCVIDQYNLAPLVHNGHVMTEIRKGMYGLPQAGLLAHDLLKDRLALDGYMPANHTPGFFSHGTLPISFTLCVDDFGIKYVGTDAAQHLIATLKKYYKITTNWNGKEYCGLTLDWDYVARTVDVSMPGYIERALLRFQHPLPARPQHSPHAWTAPLFGAQQQLTTAPDTSAPLSPPNLLFLQQVLGTLLFYARAVDNTLLVALNDLASAQSQGTESVLSEVTQLLNYCATHPDAVVRFHASDMVLHIHSDASYLSASKARSRLGGFFHLSSRLDPPDVAPSPDSSPPLLNGPIQVLSSILQVVVSSAAEAELGALFYNGKEGAALRTTLADMGHPQPATPLQTDNACAAGIINDTVKQRRSKAVDMRFYWIRDRVRQGEFLVFWRRGSDNDADYFTKHHSPSHHRKLRHRYLHVPSSIAARPPAPSLQRGCVVLPGRRAR